MYLPSVSSLFIFYLIFLLSLSLRSHASFQIADFLFSVSSFFPVLSFSVLSHISLMIIPHIFLIFALTFFFHSFFCYILIFFLSCLSHLPFSFRSPLWFLPELFLSLVPCSSLSHISFNFVFCLITFSSVSHLSHHHLMSQSLNYLFLTSLFFTSWSSSSVSFSSMLSFSFLSPDFCLISFSSSFFSAKTFSFALTLSLLSHHCLTSLLTLSSVSSLSPLCLTSLSSSPHICLINLCIFYFFFLCHIFLISVSFSWFLPHLFLIFFFSHSKLSVVLTPSLLFFFITVSRLLTLSSVSSLSPLRLTSLSLFSLISSFSLSHLDNICVMSFCCLSHLSLSLLCIAFF